MSAPTPLRPPRWFISRFVRPPAPGDAVRLLQRCGRTYVAAIRLVTWVPTLIVGVLAAWGTAQMPAVVAAVSAVSLWNVVFAYRVRRAPRAALGVVDVAVLAGFALSTALIVPPHWLATGKSWVLPFVSFAGVAFQYWARPIPGAVAGVVLSAAMVTGTVWALPLGASSAGIVTSVYALVLFLLGRILWTLAMRAGRTADDITARVEAGHRARQVAAAVRADQRALDNALHDTAAATLLMVGQGQIGTRESTLRRRARRDVDVLASFGDRQPGRADLVALLDSAVALAPIAARLTGPNQLWLPATTADAMADAAAEALNNVVKHAYATAVTLTLTGDPDTVTVEIVDNGIGFDPTTVRPVCRGLLESIHGRMADIAGRSVIESQPGRGTTVRLEWNHA